MPLAKLAIRQPIFISMVLLAVTLLEGLAYSRMGVDLYPDISNPIVSVSISASLSPLPELLYETGQYFSQITNDADISHLEDGRLRILIHCQNKPGLIKPGGKMHSTRGA